MTTNETPQPADSNRPREIRKTPKLEVALPDRDAYNPKEAAAMLGIAPRTLDTLRQRGDIRSIKVGREGGSCCSGPGNESSCSSILDYHEQ